jgi:putative protein-disulfide isomerase
VSEPHLLYFADPMCSWCWGYSPTIAAIADRFGAALPIRLVLGGLRPGVTAPMREKDREMTRSHWEHVREASGQPFDFAFFARERFVYDTEPAARALVVMRRRGQETALAGLKRLHQAFYAENRDVTDPEVLAALAGELGFDPDAFRADFASEEAIAETRNDFAFAQAVGVRGFPTLIAGNGRDNRYALVTYGYQACEATLGALENWLANGCEV